MKETFYSKEELEAERRAEAEQAEREEEIRREKSRQEKRERLSKSMTAPFPDGIHAGVLWLQRC